MTTKDNNELDEILEQAFTDVASDTIWQDNRRVEIFATAKKALLSWHNKKVERIIDNIFRPTATGFEPASPLLLQRLEQERNQRKKANRAKGDL